MKIEIVLLAVVLVIGGAVTAQQPESAIPCAQDPSGITPQPIEYGDHTVGCSIAPAADKDIFGFTADHGDVVRIVVRSHTAGFDPRIELINLTTSVTDYDDFVSGNVGPFLTAVQVTHRVDLTLSVAGAGTFGAFVIRVSDHGDTETGSFTLQLERIPPQSSAVPLPYGATNQVMDTLSPTTDFDFFRLDASLGSSIEVILQSSTPGVDLRLEVFDPTGASIFDVACPGNVGPFNNPVNCQVVATLSGLMFEGTYALIVSDSGHDEAGDYTLSLSCQSFNCPPAVPVAYPGTGEDFMLSSSSTSAGGALTTGPGHDVKPANAGDVIAANISSPAGTFATSAPLLLGQLFVTGSPAPVASGFPEIHLDPGAVPAPVILFDGPGSPLFPPSLPPGGITLSYQVPAGFAGTSLMLQGFVLSCTASNLVFAATDGHEIQFM